MLLSSADVILSSVVLSSLFSLRSAVDIGLKPKIDNLAVEAFLSIAHKQFSKNRTGAAQV